MPDQLTIPTDHRILLAVQRQVQGLVVERDAKQQQVQGLVAERDALRGIIGSLVDEAERVILAEQQATGRTLSGLQWAVDRAREVVP